jgi:hypothetical protein
MRFWCWRMRLSQLSLLCSLHLSDRSSFHLAPHSDPFGRLRPEGVRTGLSCVRFWSFHCCTLDLG